MIRQVTASSTYVQPHNHNSFELLRLLSGTHTTQGLQCSRIEKAFETLIQINPPAITCDAWLVTEAEACFFTLTCNPVQPHTETTRCLVTTPSTNLSSPAIPPKLPEVLLGTALTLGSEAESFVFSLFVYRPHSPRQIAGPAFIATVCTSKLDRAVMAKALCETTILVGLEVYITLPMSFACLASRRWRCKGAWTGCYL